MSISGATPITHKPEMSAFSQSDHESLRLRVRVASIYRWFTIGLLVLFIGTELTFLASVILYEFWKRHCRYSLNLDLKNLSPFIGGVAGPVALFGYHLIIDSQKPAALSSNKKTSKPARSRFVLQIIFRDQVSERQWRTLSRLLFTRRHLNTKVD